MAKGKINLKKTASAWSKLSPPLTVIKNETQYERAVDFLDFLIDEVRDSVNHPLSSLLDVMGVLIENYETRKYSFSQGSPSGVLRLLMEEHKISQKDLPEIGSQGVVSELLRGRRKLNARQIALLSKRFGVSPIVFFNS